MSKVYICLDWVSIIYDSVPWTSMASYASWWIIVYHGQQGGIFLIIENMKSHAAFFYPSHEMIISMPHVHIITAVVCGTHVNPVDISACQ